MNKKKIRIFSIIAGIIFLLFVIANFGVNFWLKNNLPQYIKNNSDYLVTYKTLDVNLGSGNIYSTGVTINNKDPKNQKYLGLQGTIDTLSISRVGLFDALFNKKISTSNLELSHPKINIILPESKTGKKATKKNEISVDNIKINRGDIQIFKFTKQKLFSVKDFNLKVENLELNEESAQNKLPFTFDSYSIEGKNIFFRPDNIYAVTAKYITTKAGQMSLQDFALNPLLSFQNFTKFYPKKSALLDIKSSEMQFKDIVLKDNKISLSKVQFENPVIKVFTTNAKPVKKEKGFAYDVNLADVVMKHAKIEILKPNATLLFGADQLNLNFSTVFLNGETMKEKLPFEYGNFNIEGREISYASDHQNFKVAQMEANPKSLQLQNFTAIPTATLADKSSLDFTIKNIKLKINEFKFVEKKLALNIENVLIESVKGTIISAKNPQKAKGSFAGIQFPLKVNNIELKNSDLTLERQNEPFHFHDLNAKLQKLEINEKTVQNKIPFQLGFYSGTTRNFDYKTKFYNISSSLIKISKSAVQLSNFAMKPTVSRAEFIRMIPTEKDLYDLKVEQIRMEGNWNFLSDDQFLHATEVTLEKMDANVFRSKIPNDDLTKKPMYSKMLRSIKFPLLVDNLVVKNSLLVYEEDTKKSDGPGKLFFTDFNLKAKNINSGKMKGKPTKIPIEIKSKIMGTSPLNLLWTIDTASQDDAFTIGGTVTNLPAPQINYFTEPYLKVRATGFISKINFDFKGNLLGIGGVFKMKHENLKIAILKDDGKKNTILSAVANLFVKTNSDQFPESVLVENVKRDPTRSFFNLLWHGIEQGLKKTLLGVNAPEMEKKIKKTVVDTKSTIAETKENLQATKSEFQEKISVVKENVQEIKKPVKKESLLNKIFKKKSEK